MTLIPFARQSKEADYNGERLINYFLRPSDTISTGVLIGSSGFKAEHNLGGPVRALVDETGQDPYVVANGKLWDVTGASPVSLGDVDDDPSTYIASNGRQIAVVANGKYFHWNGDTVEETATGAVTNPTSVAFLDGYFVVTGEISGRTDGFTFSAIDNGREFAGLDFAFAENATDGRSRAGGRKAFPAPRSVSRRS